MRRAVAVCLLLALAACSDKDEPAATTPSTSSPSAVEQVETLMRAIEKGDCDTVKEVVVTPSAIDCAQLSESSGMLDSEGVDLDSVQYESGTIAGDSAKVTIRWNDDLPKETIDVQRIDGTWLVDFDSSP